MYLIIKWFYSLGQISGIVPEPNLKNWKPEFSREIQEEILHMDSVFLFFSFAYGTIPEYFRRHFGIFAGNWKTEFSREIQEEIHHMDSVFSVFLFFSFAYGTIPEYFRRHFGIFAGNWKTEKQKNWKTEKLNFPERSRKRFSIWIQFFSFSVFLFFSFSVLWQNRAGGTG